MSKQLLGVVPFVQTQGAFPNCCWKNPVHLTLQEPSFSRIRQSMREGPSQHVTNQQLEPEQWKDIERNGKTKKLPALCNSLMSMLLAVTQRLQSHVSELHFEWCHGTSTSQICLIWWSRRSEAMWQRHTMYNDVTVLASSNFTRSLYKSFGIQAGSTPTFQILRVVKSPSIVTPMFDFRNERFEW